MDVALINNFPPGTGVGRYAFSVFRELRKMKNMDCKMLCPYPLNLDGIDKNEKDDIIFLTKSKSFFINRLSTYFYTHLKIPKNFDVYHANQALGIFGKQLHPSVISVYDVIPLKRREKLPKEAGLQSVMMRNIYSHFVKQSIYSIKYADQVICLAKMVQDETVSLAGVDREKTHVINEGLDHNLFKPRDKEKIRKKLGLDADKKIILHVGNERDPRKNIETLLKAYHKVQKDLDNTLLVRIGFKTNEVAKIIDKLNLNVQYFTSISDEMLSWVYNSADVCVLSSLEEGTAWTPVEAMASGCPSVVSNAPGHKDIAGESPIYVDIMDVDGYANAIKRLLTDKELRDELIPKGTKWSKTYSWDKCAKKIVGVYKKATQ